MPANLSETTVEGAVLTWLGELGYAVWHGPRTAPAEPSAKQDASNEVVLAGRLREAMRHPAGVGSAVPQSRTITSLRGTLSAKLLNAKLSVAAARSTIEASV